MGSILARVFLPFYHIDFSCQAASGAISHRKLVLERHEANEARVIPIVVRPVEWEDTPIAHLQALPADARPLSTWRNKDAALSTVVAGIRRALEDLSLLTASALHAALPPIWNIPFPRNPFFLGRDDDLVRIRRSLHTNQAIALSQPQAISGLGGIGKTQLALEYAYRYSREYQVVLWAHAESTETLYSSFVAIATLLRLPEQEEKDQGVIIEAVKRWLQAHRNWLLILDNADELALLNSFLPPTLLGHLLLVLTLRNGGSKVGREGFPREGQDYAESETNVHEGIQTGSRASVANQWKIAGANRARPGRT